MRAYLTDKEYQHAYDIASRNNNSDASAWLFGQMNEDNQKKVIANALDLLGIFSKHKDEWSAWLEKYDINLNQVDYFKRSLLKLACLEGKLEAVKALLSRTNSQSTHQLLSIAVRKGHTETVRYFCEQGVNINTYGPITGPIHQYNPLHLAAVHGHLDIVKLLIEQGASIDLLSLPGKQKYQGLSAIHIAQQAQHPEISTYLYSKGARLDERLIKIGPLPFTLNLISLTVSRQRIHHEHAIVSMEEGLIKLFLRLENGMSIDEVIAQFSDEQKKIMCERILHTHRLLYYPEHRWRNNPKSLTLKPHLRQIMIEKLSPQPFNFTKMPIKLMNMEILSNYLSIGNSEKQHKSMHAFVLETTDKFPTLSDYQVVETFQVIMDLINQRHHLGETANELKAYVIGAFIRGCRSRTIDPKKVYDKRIGNFRGKNKLWRQSTALAMPISATTTLQQAATNCPTIKPIVLALEAHKEALGGAPHYHKGEVKVLNRQTRWDLRRMTDSGTPLTQYEFIAQTLIGISSLSDRLTPEAYDYVASQVGPEFKDALTRTWNQQEAIQKTYAANIVALLHASNSQLEQMSDTQARNNSAPAILMLYASKIAFHPSTDPNYATNQKLLMDPDSEFYLPNLANQLLSAFPTDPGHAMSFFQQAFDSSHVCLEPRISLWFEYRGGLTQQVSIPTLAWNSKQDDDANQYQILAVIDRRLEEAYQASIATGQGVGLQPEPEWRLGYLSTNIEKILDEIKAPETKRASLKETILDYCLKT